MAKKNILITGGLGYLGSNLISELLKNNDDIKITVLDKGIYGVSHMAPLIDSRLDIHIGDIRDESLVKSLVPKNDYIVHLAALVGAPLVNRKPIEASDTNIEGTSVITKYISKNQLYLFASTGSTYGKVMGVCNEDTPISPLSSYGAHKALGEKIVSEKDAICMRFATVYGLSFRTRDDLYINSMVQKAIIDKSAVIYESSAMRTFIHVLDAARAIIHLMNIEHNHQIYNIGDPTLSYSKLQICKIIKENIDFNFFENNYFSDPDQRDYEVSYERLGSTNFKCYKKLENEITRLIHFYQTRFYSGYVNG